MNELSYQNATIVKELFYDASLQTSAKTINFTVENCHKNAFITQIVFNFASADAAFSNQVTVDILDRGNAYPGGINGYKPITFAAFGVGQSYQGGTLTTPLLSQRSSTVAIAQVNQSVQDSEGLGNIYVKLSRIAGTFSVNFTMSVFYKPESTINTKLKNRNQIATDCPMRVLAQTGTGTYFNSSFTDNTNFIAQNYNPRNNIDNVTFGFDVFSTSPIFYFGTPFKTRRWFLGFSSDCTPQLGVATFSYFDGNNFTAFASTQVYNGAQGPGTYMFAYDGVIIFVPPVSWSSLKMSNDPLTVYNNTLVGLGTLATNNLVYNPEMFWIQCRVGAATTIPLRVATVVPLIDPDLQLTGRRRLI